jgi:hypothetical protein
MRGWKKSGGEPPHSQKNPQSYLVSIVAQGLWVSRGSTRGSLGRLNIMKRVVILGRGASGKSTLARRLGDITGLPVIDWTKSSGNRGLSRLLASSGLPRKRSWLLGTFGSWMVSSGRMTLSRSGFVRQIRSSYWTSRWSAAPGEPFADHVNVLISGVGLRHTGIRAVRFSGQPLPSTHPMPCSTYVAALRHLVGSSRTLPLPLCQLSGKHVSQDLGPYFRAADKSGGRSINAHKGVNAKHHPRVVK